VKWIRNALVALTRDEVTEVAGGVDRALPPALGC
jgi:hypothetical protein